MSAEVEKEVYDHKDIVIVYHRTDLDGNCSAALACLWLELLFAKFPNEDDRPRLFFVGVNYGEEIYNSDWPENLEKGALLFLLDFTYPTDAMKQLAEEHTVVWVDHHATGIKIAKGIDSLRYRFSSVSSAANGKRISAAWLFYHHFVKRLLRIRENELFDGTHVTEEAVRDTVNYVSDWDTHQTDVFWEPHNNVYRFQMAMRQLDNRVRSREEFLRSDWLRIWKGGYLASVLHQGKIEVRRIEASYASLMKHSFDVKFQGATWRCINAALLNTQAFRSVYDSEKHVGFIFFNFDGALKKWKVELRGVGKGIDLGKLAESFGGGGHLGAAGFNCRVLPFSLPMVVEVAAFGNASERNQLLCPTCANHLDDSMRIDDTWSCERCEKSFVLAEM